MLSTRYNLFAKFEKDNIQRVGINMSNNNIDLVLREQ